MKYLLSLLTIIVGFLLVKYSNWLVNNFGYTDWAEQHLGSYGGTRLMWKLIGLLFIIGALLVISGQMNTILYSIFSPLIGGKKF
jgi:hypothetical protein